MKVSQFEPSIGIEEYQAIQQCFDTKWITEGKLCKEFSDKLLDLIGCKYGVFANNGTLSLYMALRSLNIGPGDEVLVPNFTFIASANSVIMTGATPVFVDVEEETFHIDLEKAQRQISEKTKAIMPVHIYGTSANMKKIKEFSEKNGLKIVEDAAQAIGVNWQGDHCGSLGHVGSFSFFADKTITTGEGGFVCTNDEKTYEKLLYIRNQGRINRGSFIHPEIGFNFRITDIQAAIGIVQFGKLPQIIDRKLEILEIYKNNLQDIEKIKIHQPEKGSNHVPFRVAITDSDGRRGLIDHMENNNIETRTFFYPLHLQPCFSKLDDSRGHLDDDMQASVKLYKNGICLPSYPSMDNEKVEYVCKTIRDYYGLR